MAMPQSAAATTRSTWFAVDDTGMRRLAMV